ncbi:MAG: hypothetical protein HUN04_17915 [Desulfobacter sp.]|nr:MAG: hypothetical protein HUN04_17915 [Desulfobacter sp.]
MKSKCSRRRFLSLCSYGTMLLAYGGSTFASDLPRCESGEIVRNGWRAKWDGKAIEIKDGKRSPSQRYTEDLKLFFKSQSHKYRGEKAGINSFLHLTFNYDTSISNTPWISIRTPRFFETKAARYDARYKVDYAKDGYYRTPILDGVSGMAEVRLTLRRKGTRGLYTVIKAYGTGTFSLEDDELNRFLGEGANPLEIEFSADGQTLFSRKYDVNGILRAYSEAKPKYLAEKLRADNKRCDPGCFLTTAVCGHIGLDDDCWELRTLRKFRDNYLMKTKTGRRQIDEYYSIAPIIVERINLKNNSQYLYLSMYWKFILPSAVLIKMGLLEKAHSKYYSLVKWAKALTL